VEMFHSFSTGQEKGHVLRGLSNGNYPTKWEGDTVLLKRLTASSPSDRPSATEILVTSRITLSLSISKYFLIILDV
jgi:hypothetical protein